MTSEINNAQFGVPFKNARHYAQEIMDLPTREARRAALAGVPEWCRQATETHVRNAFALAPYQKKVNQVKNFVHWKKVRSKKRKKF